MTAETSATRLRAALTAIETLEAQLAADLAALSPEERRRTPRPRLAFLGSARTFLYEARRQPDISLVLGYDLDEAERTLDEIELLQLLIIAQARLLKQLEDARLQRSGKVWNTFLRIYGTARVNVLTNPKLRTLVELLAPLLKRPRKAPTVTTTTTTTTTTSTTTSTPASKSPSNQTPSNQTPAPSQTPAPTPQTPPATT